MSGTLSRTDCLSPLPGHSIEEFGPKGSFHCPTRIRFGWGVHREVLQVCQESRSRRLALLTGSRSASSQKHLPRLQKELQELGLEVRVLGGIPQEPSCAVVDEIVRTLWGFTPDLILAWGGGSVLDTAKLVSLILTNGGAGSDYEWGRSVRRPGIPLIALPTTAGSGSEATPYSVLFNPASGRKFTVTEAALFPRHALVDPALTLSCPREVTLASGLDAWVHALEAFLSRQANPLIDPWCLTVLSWVFRWLPVALAEPGHREARSHLSGAALLGGLIIAQVRTGLIHTMSVALAPHVGLPHGLLNAVLTPWVLEFNRGGNRERLRQAVTHMTGQAPLHDGEARVLLREWLFGLGVAKGLKSLSLSSDLIPSLVERVGQDQGLPEVNPRPFTRRELTRLFEGVMEN